MFLAVKGWVKHQSIKFSKNFDCETRKKHGNVLGFEILTKAGQLLTEINS